MTLLDILEGGVPAVAFLLMVAVGLDVTRDDLHALRRSRALVAWATLAQVVLLPAAALAIADTLRPDRRITDYLLLTAACPGGGMSNVYVYLARANTALSVTLTAVSSLLAVLTMPAIIEAYEMMLGRRVGFALPVQTLFAQLLVMAVIPVAIGAFVRETWPALERQYGGRLRAITAIGVAGIVAVGMVQSAGSLPHVLVTGTPAAAALVVAGMIAGWGMGAVFRASGADRFTLLVEFGVRSLAIAMVIQVTLLHDPAFVPFGAVALFAQALLLMIGVAGYRSRARRA